MTPSQSGSCLFAGTGLTLIALAVLVGKGAGYRKLDSFLMTWMQDLQRLGFSILHRLYGVSTSFRASQKA